MVSRALSFSNEVKNELARIEPQKACCDRAELYGLLRMSGAIVISGRGTGIHFSTENAALARRMLQLLKSNFELKTEVVITRSRRLKKNNRYQVRVLSTPEVATVLEELQLLADVEAGRNKLLAAGCCRRSFLRGVFMAGGSVSRPASDYHLELVTESYDFAELIKNMMQSFALPVKMTDRKKEFIVYLKEGNAITSFLSVIGAHNALMEFENVRIIKEMRNNVNRIVNCETANLNKTVQAAVHQIESIKYIEEISGLASLPPVLRETAELRLSYPEASLSELADMASGRIGKSGINHRLKKLEQMAKDLGMGD
ncbi:MAG: DNA-binding protein WhiA [Acholeplasmataceae bacterium]|nr:DNA-binding protein WhiA [Acidaminococcaceae bacterium]NLY83211.1 DNA-binding protein WhiA [Acholeplasmataceae bacterium]